MTAHDATHNAAQDSVQPLPVSPSVEPAEQAESTSKADVGMISPREILSISWEGIARNKVRSLLTMLGA